MKRNQYRWKYFLLALFSIPLSLVSTTPNIVHAGGTIEIDDVRSVSVGMGLRSSFIAKEDDAPDKMNYSNDFLLDSFRFYMSGQLLEKVTFEFNADYNTLNVQTPPVPPSTTPGTATTTDLRVLDGVLKFAFNDYFNVWFGRFLPPSDRANLSGPYFLNSWDFPFVQAYPNVYAGRDDGVAIWGQVGGGMFKYQFGAFEGKESNGDHLLYAGRLTLNLLDPEPGYYNSSTYYGSKDVLAIGLVGMTQNNALGTAGAGDFVGWNIDLLAEKNLGEMGVATVEGAFYDYDGDGVGAASVGGTEGSGYFILASYLCPTKVGTGSFQGQLQPLVRYQRFDTDGVVDDRGVWDIALNYILNGHNARITANYSLDDQRSGGDINIFKLGLQFQI